MIKSRRDTRTPGSPLPNNDIITDYALAFEAPTWELYDAIKRGASASAAELGLLSTVRLQIRDGRLHVASYDYDHAVDVSIEPDRNTSRGDGIACVDPARLHDALETISSETVAFRGTLPVAALWGPDCTVILRTAEPESHPALPEPRPPAGAAGKRGTVPGALFAAAARAAAVHPRAQRRSEQAVIAFDIADGVCEVTAEAGPATTVQHVALDGHDGPDGLEAIVPASPWVGLARKFAAELQHQSWEVSLGTDRQGSWLTCQMHDHVHAAVHTRVTYGPTPGRQFQSISDEPVVHRKQREVSSLKQLLRDANDLRADRLFPGGPSHIRFDHRALQRGLATLPEGRINVHLTETGYLCLAATDATAVIAPVP